jgi:hypothetical protein
LADLHGPPIVNWKMLEPASGILVSDAAGTLPDLDADGTPNTRPNVIEAGLTGFARVFTSLRALEGEDTASALDLRRSMTFSAIVRFDITAQAAAATPGTIASYGFRNGAGEDNQFLVELLAVDAPARRATVRMRWEDASGVLETGNVGADFFLPVSAGGGIEQVLLTVVREWLSDTDVIVRYYANDIFLGKDLSNDGNIGGAPGAIMTLGVRGSGAAATYENYLRGELSATAIWDRVMSAEEVRQIYMRAAFHGPAQYESLKGLLPEGVYSNDPSSIVQREIFVEAMMFGLCASKIAELHEDFLPDRAWSFLDRWERVLGLIPLPHATLSERRNALLSFLRTVQGFNKPGITDALEPTFDLDEADIEILEYSHFLTDDFTTAIGTMWHVHAGAHSVSISGGDKLRIQLAIGSEAAWHRVDAGEQAAPHVKCCLDRYDTDAEPSLDAQANVKVNNPSFTTNDQVAIGVAFVDQTTNSIIVWGVSRNGGSNVLTRVTIISGVETISYHGAIPATPFYLDVKFIGGDSYELSTAPGSNRNDLTLVTTQDGPINPGACALVAHGLDVGGSPDDDRLDFDDFQLYTPNGRRVFSWYAYRDPLLPGEPDIPAARLVVRRIKPAHTKSSAVTAKALLCDDPDSLCDDGPLGGEP